MKTKPRGTGRVRQRWDLVTAERSTVYRVRAWSRSHAERQPLDDINEVDCETHSIEAERDPDQQTETRPAPAPKAEARPGRGPQGGA
jgi:hypothetical protein